MGSAAEREEEGYDGMIFGCIILQRGNDIIPKRSSVFAAMRRCGCVPVRSTYRLTVRLFLMAILTLMGMHDFLG